MKTLGATTTFTYSTYYMDNISMDFIVGLPKSGNKSIIMVVVDHLSKYAHFCALQHPFKASMVAQVFMDNIFKLHGMPQSIVMTMIPLSLVTSGKNCLGSRALNCILALPITPRLMVKHEVVNKCLEAYLRCFTSKQYNPNGFSGYP
jgi:hypothetical protein